MVAQAPGMETGNEFADALMRSCRDIRYVAILHEGRLTMRQREQLDHASSSESDRYEELIVNPTLLTLVTQRGNIDCGGARFVLIRYGNFFQCVAPIAGGHISIGMEPGCDPLQVAEKLLPAIISRP